ncbi:kinase-like protein [Leucogyrophana mollusca]|uniref:Kinase-like protein n=1 Tax=Leucogyrophana mollusca TaxID=85980 RepID=A0ACB8BD81_9AGAM|nr:kinase-like protein [Leucogyrophana mollusca]
MEFTLGGKYRLEEIAIGGCGIVFSGIHTIAGKEVAINLEPAVPSSWNASSPLKQESKVYRTLVGGLGVPWTMWSSKQGDYNVTVTDTLGASLEDLFGMCNRHFTSRCFLMPSSQTSRLEFIHSRDFIHRDVKPTNIVDVINFGLAKKFRDPKAGAHIPYRKDDHHGVGTSLFVSLNAHDGIKCSQRDDLKSLVYMLIYFLRGTLSWRKTKGTTVSAPWDAIHTVRLAALPLLTAGLPAEFAVFFEYARGLKFGDLPDYEGLRELFRGLVGRVGVQYSGVSDWTLAW